jgi:hypothetical protein
MSATGRPEREYRSAQHEGSLVSATDRPERECRSAQHEGAPVSVGRAVGPASAGRCGRPESTPRVLARRLEPRKYGIRPAGVRRNRFV